MRPLKRFGRFRAPWFQAQVPVIRVRVLCRVSTTSVAFSRPLSARASLTCLQACDMAFSGLPVSPGDVLWSARYPCLVSAESVPPGHQPGSRDGLLSGRGFPRDDSRFPPRDFHLAVLSAHSGRVTLFRGVTHGYAQVSILPLLSRAQQSFLTPYRGQDPDEHRWARVLNLLRRLCALTSTRTVSGLLRSIAAVTLRPAGSAGYPCLCA